MATARRTCLDTHRKAERYRERDRERAGISPTWQEQEEEERPFKCAQCNHSNWPKRRNVQMATARMGAELHEIF